MRMLLATLASTLLSTPAWSQTVTLADLQGSVITVSSVNHERIIIGGEMRSVELHTNGQVRIGAGGAISGQFQSSATNEANGNTRMGRSNTSSGNLDRPHQGGNNNEMVWTFTNGELVRLRVYSEGEGGQKMSIKIRRAGSGLACSFSIAMAREVGVGRIHKNATVGGMPIEILDFRQVGSSCQITKG
jgi:hypothetical protein